MSSTYFRPQSPASTPRARHVRPEKAAEDASAIPESADTVPHRKTTAPSSPQTATTADSAYNTTDKQTGRTASAPVPAY